MAISDVKTIRQCLRVAELRSMSRAASALNMAQPWLSTRVRAYEAELGFELFDRSRRQLAVTPQGETWAVQARRFIEAADSYSRAIRSIAAPAEMELQIGCPASASGVAERDDLIQGFRARYPQVTVNIHLLPNSQLAAGQRSGELDLVLMNDPLPDDFDSATGIVLRRQHAVVFMPRAWKIGKSETLDLSELAGREIAIFPEIHSPGLSGPMHAALRTAGARPVVMSDTNFVALHHHAIKHGIGAITVDTMADTLAYVPDFGCYRLAGDPSHARLWLLRPPESATREALLFWQFAAAWRKRTPTADEAG